MSAQAASKRVAWIDVAKAIGISLIVIGHANRSIDRSAGLNWTDGYQLLDSVLYAFHVPLFFLLAGISAALARSGWRRGIGSIVVGLILPYLIWSAIWIVSKALLPGSMVNQPLALSQLWHILWVPVDHFWFLYHLVLIRLIWLVAELTLGRVIQSVVLLGLFATGFLLRVLGPEWGVIAHFIENTAFFGVGFLVLRHVVDDARHLGTAAMICAMSFVSLVAFQIASGLSTFAFVTGLVGALAVIFAVAHFGKSGNGRIQASLVSLGQASLVIFLLHGFAIGFVRSLLNRFDLLTNDTLLVAGTLAGIGLPFLAYLIVDRLSRAVDKPIAQWIGWGRWRRPAVAV